MKTEATTGRPARPSRRALLGLLLLVAAAAGTVQWLQRRPAPPLDAAVAAAVRPGDIRMIASVGCVYCAAARTWFNDNRLPFTECLIERDAACAAAFQVLQAPGTPVLVVRGRRLVGFDARAVADALTTDPS